MLFYGVVMTVYRRPVQHGTAGLVLPQRLDRPGVDFLIPARSVRQTGDSGISTPTIETGVTIEWIVCLPYVADRFKRGAISNPGANST